MGLYDREYYQEDREPGFHIGGGDGPASVTTILIVVNCVVYLLLELFLRDATIADASLYNNLALQSDWMKQNPVYIYQLFTAGFLHAPLESELGIFHLIFNMIGLYIFGRPIEQKYGRREFLLFYLVTMVFANAVWFLMHLLATKPAAAVGASGAVTGVVILFCLNFPRQRLAMFGAIEMPAWVLGLVLVGLDFLRALNPSSEVGWQAHLAGAAFGLMYVKMGIQLERWIPKKRKRRPKLKVHRPTNDVDAQADRILQKINQEGMDSLTSKEKKILEQHSRQVRDRKTREQQ